MAFMAVAGCSREQKANSPTPTVTAPALAARAATIIGALGKPLGNVTEIEAVVVSDKFPNWGLVRSTIFLLQVEKIDGQLIEKPVRLRFTVEGMTVIRVAPGEHELTKLISDLQTPDAKIQTYPFAPEIISAPVISKAEAEAMRANYVGSRHRLIVYETGKFFGTPSGLPEDCGYLQSNMGFGFESYLVVLAER